MPRQLYGYEYDSATDAQKKARKDSKVNHSDDAESFVNGNFDEKKYQIVDISTQYDYTYKNMETGRRTSVIRNNYFNFKTMKYRFRKNVYGTKKFYRHFKNGKIDEYWANPTAGYGDLMKMDPQLEYESNVFAGVVGAVVFALFFALVCWIVRKIALATIGSCTKKTKIVKHLDVDAHVQDWNANDMSTKKESENTDPAVLTLTL